MQRLAWCLAMLLAIALLPGRAVAAHHAHRPGHHHRRMSYARYRHYVRLWHKKDPKRKAPLDAHGRPELVIESINTREQIALSPISDRGGFSASELERAARVLRDQHTGNEFPVDPGVVDILYRLQRHFKTHSIRVISAYRTPHRGSHSRHGQGRAIDLVVPGASDRAVARFVRDLGFCGVGVYTRSGFVHVDVRARSYFWVDHSGPGQPNRARTVLRKLAKGVDRRALAAGCPRPHASVRPDPDVEAVWNADSVWPETRLARQLAAHRAEPAPQRAHGGDQDAKGNVAAATSDQHADDSSNDEANDDDRTAEQAAERGAK